MAFACNYRRAASLQWGDPYDHTVYDVPSNLDRQWKFNFISHRVHERRRGGQRRERPARRAGARRGRRRPHADARRRPRSLQGARPRRSVLRDVDGATTPRAPRTASRTSRTSSGATAAGFSSKVSTSTPAARRTTACSTRCISAAAAGQAHDGRGLRRRPGRDARRRAPLRARASRHVPVRHGNGSGPRRRGIHEYAT